MHRPVNPGSHTVKDRRSMISNCWQPPHTLRHTAGYILSHAGHLQLLITAVMELWSPCGHFPSFCCFSFLFDSLCGIMIRPSWWDLLVHKLNFSTSWQQVFHHTPHLSTPTLSVPCLHQEIPTTLSWTTRPSDGLMTPGHLAYSYPVDSRCCHPGTTQSHLCPWCMDPDRTGGRGTRRNMCLRWILLIVSQGIVFHNVQGELPFMGGNNAAMLVNWWVRK